MKPPVVLPTGVKIAIVAIVLLGLLGGSLIVAYSGFGTSPRRGGPSTFVPVPQAYFLAATMYSMSVIGMYALLQSWKCSRTSMALALAAYAGAAVLLIRWLAP